MCGLTGVAFNPKHGDLELARHILRQGLLSIEKRGHHATGVGACGKAGRVFKWAETASKVVESEAWKAQMDKLTTDDYILIGHTRHSTHANSHLPEAAHPFVEGRIVGAHNGIINNWLTLARRYGRDVGKERLIVDSQAIFLLLDRIREPQEALRELSGYFSITWWKNGKLYFARCDGAPMWIGYLPEERMLVWNSEKENLKRMVGDREITYWQTKPGDVYIADPTKFSKGSGGAQLAHIRNAFDPKRSGYFNSANPNQKRGKSVVRIPASTSTGSSLYSGGSLWDPYEAKEVFGGNTPVKSRGRGGAVSILDLDREIRGFYDTLGAITRTLKKIQDQNEALIKRVKALEDESLYLLDLLVERGVLTEDDAYGVEEEEDNPPFVTSETSPLMVPCVICRKEMPLADSIVDHKGNHLHAECIFHEAKKGGKEKEARQKSKLEVE